MSNRNLKIDNLLSLIRGVKRIEHTIAIVERDESGNKVVLSKVPIPVGVDFDLEIELLSSEFSPASSEEEIRD